MFGGRLGFVGEGDDVDVVLGRMLAALTTRSTTRLSFVADAVVATPPLPLPVADFCLVGRGWVGFVEEVSDVGAVLLQTRVARAPQADDAGVGAALTCCRRDRVR